MQQTTPHIPEDLQQAINELYLWVKEGCPDHKDFDCCAGICSNVSWFLGDSAEVAPLLFGDNEYPFNTCWQEYNSESNKFTNPKRLAWLQEHQTVE